MNYSEEIVKAKECGWKIGIYGLGLVYSKAINDLLDFYRFIPDFYCDKNELTLAQFDSEGKRKVLYSEIIKETENIVIIATVGWKLHKSVKESFEGYENIRCITFPEICESEEYLKKYFSISDEFEYYDNADNNELQIISPDIEEKIAVYTCITGRYDDVKQPIKTDSRCDYFLITDNDIEDVGIYKKISVSDILPRGNFTDKDKNRYCKMHGYKIFDKYRYSIYLDGNFQIVGDITNLLGYIGRRGLSFHIHPWARDVYAEAVLMATLGRIKKEEGECVVNRFIQNHFPRFYGDIEGGIVVSDNNNTEAAKILNRWFENYIEGEAKRDQLYFPYSLYQLDVNTYEVATYDKNYRTDGITIEVEAHDGYQR